MKLETPSRTAENNAFARACESLKAPGERICHDPYAVYFLNDELLSAYQDQGLREEMLAGWDNLVPGVRDSVLARCRFIDDYLEYCIDDGITQLVNLGAGFDTRFFRFDALKAHVRVFELDHPATQKEKLGKLNNIQDLSVDHVTYIPVLFENELFYEKLFDHHYDPTLKTLFIWEGVTYYIPREAVDETLSFITHHSGAGSSIVFDYFPPTVADGTCPLKEAKALVEGLKTYGEEIVFGIEPDHIDIFLSEKGFTSIQNVRAEKYKNLYFKGKNQGRAVSKMFVFVRATVK